MLARIESGLVSLHLLRDRNDLFLEAALGDCSCGPEVRFDSKGILLLPRDTMHGRAHVRRGRLAGDPASDPDVDRRVGIDSFHRRHRRERRRRAHARGGHRNDASGCGALYDACDCTAAAAHRAVWQPGLQPPGGRGKKWPATRAGRCAWGAVDSLRLIVFHPAKNANSREKPPSFCRETCAETDGQLAANALATSAAFTPPKEESPRSEDSWAW